ELLKEMGLEKKDHPSPAPPAAPPPAAEGTPAPEGGAAPEAAAPAKKGQRSGSPAAPSFRRAIHPLLLQACRSCHAAGGAAAATRMVLTDDAAADHAVVSRLCNVRNAAASPLLAKASGQQPHGGGAPWPADGAAYARVLGWIQRGARLDAG